jgi:hypothetical protein
MTNGDFSRNAQKPFTAECAENAEEYSWFLSALGALCGEKLLARE